MKTSCFPSQTLFFLCATLSSCLAAPLVWDNSNGTNDWSTGANWDTNIEPTAADELTFPLGLAGTITTTTTENALSLTFNDAYTLSGGTLALASGNSINVADGVTATINNALTITGGLSKTGTGTLVLGGNNTNPGGTVISAGRIRAASTGSMGAAGAVTTVNGGTILEVANAIILDRPITLMQGGTVAGLGTATNNGKITIDAAATSVTLATDQAGDVFSVGSGANDVTGGTSATVIGLSGPGAVRLGAASDFDGSWSIPSGRLELGAAAALGDQTASSVTLSGGTLSARLATATTFTGPATNLIVTADSGLLSDRNSVSAGVTHILGTLSMGAQTLTVAPGASATSGTAGITLGNVTFTGNPVLAINDSGATNGKLTTGSLLGGSARSIVKSGAGDLSVTGGATDLPVGSAFSASGGGTVEMLFPDLGAAASIAISSAQNPFGTATISVTDGGLRLLANASNSSAVQTLQLPSAITLGGTVTLDADERSGSNSNKTFELSGLTLASGTELSMSGDNLYGVRLTGPLVLQGSATLKGIDTASKDGLLNLAGGISGGPTTALTIAGGTSPLNLTIGAASTYGGGTAMSGSNVTLNAANAFGSGATTLSGGSLIVNAADALGGTVTLSGGALRVNEATFLANNSVLLQGGTLDLRNNAGASISTTALTLSGSSTLNLANNGSGSSQAMIVPLLNVSGDSILTLTNANSYTPTFTSLALAGSLTLNNGITARIQSISEDASARTLVKTGTGVLELEGASSHSGGTEILAGTLLVEHASALGTGDLTVGATSGTATATAQFNSGLSIANDIVIRSGSSGIATLDSISGGVTWTGVLTLQKAVTLDVGSSASSHNGVLSGTGTITKISSGELVLGNAANSFLGDIAVSAGTLTVATNGALGNAANGVNLTSSGILQISGTFTSGRTINVTGTATDVNVTSGNMLTLTAPVAGTGTFAKGDSGTLEFAPAVDATARGSSLNQLNAGTLRLQGALNLGNANPLTIAGGTLQLFNDVNTDFAHPVTTTSATTTIHVDRAAGGVATGGRHTLGELTATTSNLTVTGANGFGLTLDGYTTTSNSSIANNAPGTLILSALNGNPSTSSRTLTVGGTGDMEVAGATTEGAGTGSYGIVKEGTGRFTFGSSVTEFNRILTVEDGVVDLNGLSYTTTGLVTLGGSASLLGAQIETGAGGSLNLGAGLTFTNTGNPAGALITGNLGLGTIPQTFTVNDSSGASIDLTLDGPTTGGVGSSIAKSGNGTLRFTGTGNTLPGLVTVSAGLLELAKSSGDAIGTGGLAVTGGTTRLLAAGQIHNSGAVSLNSGNEVFLELNGFSETTGPVSLTQTDSNDYSAVKTGAAGTLVLNGDLTLNNNTNSSGADGREVLITGTGSETVSATDGTLDLGGATPRTIHVATTTGGANETKANATIETQIVNGGILKTGPRTLFLSHPNNTFAGGLEIAEGSVKPATLASLGTGPVSFSNSGAASAGIDLGTLTGTLAGDFIIGGSGSGAVTLTYSALAPNALVLSGNFDLQRDLTADVVNGSTTVDSSATLELSGTLSDGAATSGLTKIGNGTLKLSGSSSFEGPVTVGKGILSASTDAALGDPAATLIIDGGCFLPAATFTSTRDLVFGPAGGSVRGDSPNQWTHSGDVTWSAGTSAFFGTGTTILSGSSTGPGGDLQLGEPTAFATVPFSPIIPVGHVLSLRGSAALPAGNLAITHGAVLELGNGDFTRALGTGAGEVQLPTADGAGWAAHGADRSVNLGGVAAPVIWGQTSPPFLYQNTGAFDEQGDLVLGSATATHTVDFQNPIDFDNGTTYILRDLVVPNGPAALEARLSGGITQAADPETTFTLLDLEVEGALEITGPISGEFHLAKYGAGTATIAGTNNSTGDIGVFEGTLVITSNAGTGTPRFVTIDPTAELDASALATPLVLGDGSQFYNAGIFRGDLEGPAYFDGSGLFDGDLHVLINGYLDPGFVSMMQVVGDFTLDSGATLNFNADGIVPDTEYTRMSVAGSVTLGGFFEIYPGYLTEGSTFVFLLNDGTDPISGTFDGLPEGAGVPIGDGLALQVTYLANGDGGAVGNDFGATVVPDTFSSDLSLIADAPVAVDLGAEIVINYTVDSPGPGFVNDGVLEITLPLNATFVSSTPAGTINSGVLSIPLPPLAAPDTTGVELRLTAPGVTDAVLVDAYVGSVSDAATGNNYFGTTTAVLPDGRPVLSIFTTDPVNDTLTLGIDTISGVIYELESSIELIYWMYEETIYGDGEPFQITLPMDLDEEFFRFRIVPNNRGGGGGES